MSVSLFHFGILSLLAWWYTDFRLTCRLPHCTTCNRSRLKLGDAVCIPDW